MNRDEFRISLAKLLSRDDIAENASLAEISEWDSLNQIALVSLCKKEFNILLTAKAIRSCHNVGDILNLIFEQ